MPPRRTRTDKTGPQKKQKTGVIDNSDVEEHAPTAAVELEGTTLVHDGDQSPVLDRMCHGHFEESRTFTICLPDDNPDAIRAVIHYLYSGDTQKFGSVDPPGSTITALFDLAELYGVAEKYQLQGLKTLIIKKLESILDVAQQPIEFIVAAKEIYNCIPDSDKDFRDFFKQASAKLLLPRVMPKVLRQQFDDHMAEGGTMAIDMVAALCSKYDAQISRMRRTAETSYNKIEQLTIENGELSRAKERYKEDNERLEKSSNGTT
ncbi:MAG: hypothetical protein Q9226_006897 [Calogaya cf. arnoldii]